MVVMDAITNADEMQGVPASFMRGGTSKGLFFRWGDLPSDRDAFLCAALGSPDANGRQLDGMGGGISSLSKAMMVRRSERDGVDIDYLFAQVAVDKPVVDYASNCGNLSAAVGAFAVNQGFVQLPDGPGVVRMYNENTSKRVDCHVQVRRGRAAVGGDQAIAGVAGQGAPIRLDFLDPGGARTGRLLPLDQVLSEHDGVPFSFVDAGNPCVFVDAAALGADVTALPSLIDVDGPLMARLEAIRRAAGHLAGLADRAEDVPESAPKVAMVGPAAASVTLAGDAIDPGACDIQIRMISMARAHLAIPLTGAMCAAVAARIPGSVVANAARDLADDQPLRIGTASGVVPALAQVTPDGHAIKASVYRTARLLMDGTVYGAA